MRLGTKSVSDSDGSAFERLKRALDIASGIVVAILWVSAIVILVLGITATCRAQCDVVDRLVDQELNGVGGFFIPTADLECLTIGLELGRAQAVRVELLEDRLQIQDGRIERLLEVTELDDEIIDRATMAADRAIRTAVDATSSRSLWTMIAFVGGAVISAAIAVAVAIGGS